jgi:hypothetical protein
MSESNSKNPSRMIAAVILILVILAAILFLGYLVQNKITETLDPLRQVNAELGTQVANLLHPTPTIIPDPVTIIHEVQALARLETIRYNVEKVITAETGQGAFAFLIQDRLLLVAHGTVIAGIDMAMITSDSMWLDQGVLNVRLPAAEVFIASLDNEKTYVYDRDTGLLKNPDPNLETIARQAAEEEILKAALEDGILDQATNNAKMYLQWFFDTLGYHQINFVPASP